MNIWVDTIMLSMSCVPAPSKLTLFKTFMGSARGQTTISCTNKDIEGVGRDGTIAQHDFHLVQTIYFNWTTWRRRTPPPAAATTADQGETLHNTTFVPISAPFLWTIIIVHLWYALMIFPESFVAMLFAILLLVLVDVIVWNSYSNTDILSPALDHSPADERGLFRPAIDS